MKDWGEQAGGRLAHPSVNEKGEADCVDQGLLVYFSTSNRVQKHIDASHEHIMLCLFSH
jgi:hypothetical protein